MKKKVIPVLFVIALILIIIMGIVISSLIKKYTPGKERQDLSEYYNVTADDQAAIILNQELSESSARLIEGKLYLDFHFLQDNLNPRFYWDSNENILLYTTAKDLISAEADNSSYMVNRDSVSYDIPIVKATSDSAWVSIDFARMYSDFQYTYEESPSRVIITNEWKEYETAIVKKNTEIRVLGGIKSPIVTDVAKNSEVYVLSSRDDDWTKVMTQDGFIGYIISRRLGKTSSITMESDYVAEEFTHIKKDFPISMAWHQVFSRVSTAEVAAILEETKGINVISPTWFYLDDNDGNIVSFADAAYVEYCHDHDVEVWALINNLENQEVDTAEVLSRTSSRQHLINQLISAAIQYNLDGINLDFETLNAEKVGDSYIQFVRELSLKCANNGIVLSVDNYVPSAYTSFYNRAEQALFADYVVIMAYDEHYAGGEEAGSVSSLNWVKEAVTNTLKEVPADQIILGIPFYTRIWELTPVEGSDGTDSSGDYVLYDISSKAYGMESSYNIVRANGAEIQWLDDCGQHYAEYKQGDSIFKVWLEDAASTEERLKVMQEHQLAGAGYWKLGFETADIWDVIIKYIN